MSAQVMSMNAARKRRAGLADTGRCGCGRFRVQCRDGCIEAMADRMIQGLDELYLQALVRQEVEIQLRDREWGNVLHR